MCPLKPCSSSSPSPSPPLHSSFLAGFLLLQLLIYNYHLFMPLLKCSSPLSYVQTDIVAVRTPQEGSHSFLSTRAPSPLDTSDSDCTKLGETPSPRRNQDSPRSRSPRPSSLPGVGDNSSLAATPKRSLPRGSEVRVICFKDNGPVFR